MRGLLALKAAILELFEKFGYLMWTIFSVAFSVGLGILSYPFFSELMSMPLGGLLYAVPSITIPTLILGLLLMVMAIFRRRVKLYNRLVNFGISVHLIG